MAKNKWGVIIVVAMIVVGWAVIIAQDPRDTLLSLGIFLAATIVWIITMIFLVGRPLGRGELPLVPKPYAVLVAFALAFIVLWLLSSWANVPVDIRFGEGDGFDIDE